MFPFLSMNVQMVVRCTDLETFTEIEGLSTKSLILPRDTLTWHQKKLVQAADQ